MLTLPSSCFTVFDSQFGVARTRERAGLGAGNREQSAPATVTGLGGSSSWPRSRQGKGGVKASEDKFPLFSHLSPSGRLSAPPAPLASGVKRQTSHFWRDSRLGQQHLLGVLDSSIGLYSP